MISFVIIGKNEGWKLTKCIESVQTTILENNIEDFEVIYVDSKSSDNSISRAKAFNNVKIFEITGETNAAIARNIGARETNGESIFFIDGDMEILPEFIQYAFDENKELKYECVTGHLDDIFYDQSFSFIKRSPRTYKNQVPSHEIELLSNGGIFLIKREYWNEVGGMKTKYRRCQDMDFTLRLIRMGILTIRLPYMIALHHTIDYRDEKRMWQFIFNGNQLYPAVLTREHLLSFNFLKLQLRSHYTAILFFSTAVISLFSLKAGMILFMLYFIALILKVYFNSKSAVTSSYIKFKYYLSRFLYQITQDIMFMVGFFFFYPTSQKAEYREVKVSYFENR